MQSRSNLFIFAIEIIEVLYKEKINYTSAINALMSNIITYFENKK